MSDLRCLRCASPVQVNVTSLDEPTVFIHVRCLHCGAAGSAEVDPWVVKEANVSEPDALARLRYLAAVRMAIARAADSE